MAINGIRAALGAISAPWVALVEQKLLLQEGRIKALEDRITILMNRK